MTTSIIGLSTTRDMYNMIVADRANVLFVDDTAAELKSDAVYRIPGAAEDADLSAIPTVKFTSNSLIPAANKSFLTRLGITCRLPVVTVGADSVPVVSFITVNITTDFKRGSGVTSGNLADAITSTVSYLLATPDVDGLYAADPLSSMMMNRTKVLGTP